MPSLHRRRLLESLGLAAGGALVPPTVEAAPTDRSTARGAPDREAFPQGVASGDPTPSGAVVWTRLSPSAHSDGDSVSLTVARDEDFQFPIGFYDAGTTGADRDYTVKADLDGRLDANRTYWYRFEHDGRVSPAGRLRTLPEPGSSPDSVSFALCTCQDYRNGYYGAYRHVADDDVDFLLHLGDFVYEHGGPSEYAGRDINLPSGNAVASGLSDFRHLHRTYRTDRALQAALAAHTAITTWDDHEIVNDRFYSYRDGRPYAGDDAHPRNDDDAFMRSLFAAGIRAWWEYTPARVRYDPDADVVDSLGLYRSFQFGDLLDLVVTDERLFRSAPPQSELPTPLATSLADQPSGPGARQPFSASASGRGSPTRSAARRRPGPRGRTKSSTWTSTSTCAARRRTARTRGRATRRSVRLSPATSRLRRTRSRSPATCTLAPWATSTRPTTTPRSRSAWSSWCQRCRARTSRRRLTYPPATWRRRCSGGPPARRTPVSFFDSHHWGTRPSSSPRGSDLHGLRCAQVRARGDASRELLTRYRVPAGSDVLQRRD